MCEEWTYGKCVNELCPLRHMQINVCNHLSPYHFFSNKCLSSGWHHLLLWLPNHERVRIFWPWQHYVKYFLSMVYILIRYLMRIYVNVNVIYQCVIIMDISLIMIYDLFLFTLKVQRNNIQCYWEKQPSGCQKPHCMFKHLKPRLSTGAVDGKVISVQGNGSPGTSQPWLSARNMSKDLFVWGNRPKEEAWLFLDFYS